MKTIVCKLRDDAKMIDGVVIGGNKKLLGGGLVVMDGVLPGDIAGVKSIRDVCGWIRVVIEGSFVPGLTGYVSDYYTRESEPSEEMFHMIVMGEKPVMV